MGFSDKDNRLRLSFAALVFVALAGHVHGQEIARSRALPAVESVTSFVDWMTLVANASGGHLHESNRLESEEGCVGSLKPFCDKTRWRSASIHLDLLDPSIFGPQFHSITEDLPQIAVQQWCGSRQPPGSISNERAGIFCGGNEHALAVLLRVPSISDFYWIAVEPAPGIALDDHEIQLAFEGVGFKDREAITAYLRRFSNLSDEELRQERLENQKSVMHRHRLNQRVKEAAAIQADQLMAAAEARRFEERKLQANLVRKIGAKVCSTRENHSLQASIRFIGFTEAISPDNGRVQIRVSSASIAGAPNLSPSGFEPHVVWDDPMNWEPCE
jgi:hypothetical protein